MKNSKHRYYGPDCEGEEMPKKKASDIVKKAKEKQLNKEVEEIAETKDEQAKPKKKLHGRPAIDTIVDSRSGIDNATYTMISASPMYAGATVDSRLPKIKLNKSAQSSSLISELIGLYNYIKFDSDDAFIMYEGVRYNCNVNILKFMKALLVNHMNPNMEYSSLLAETYQYILNTIIQREEFLIPMPASCESNLKKTIKEEIDSFFETILKENKVSYSKVVETTTKPTKKKKSAFDEAMQIMEMSNGKD